MTTAQSNTILNSRHRMAAGGVGVLRYSVRRPARRGETVLFIEGERFCGKKVQNAQHFPRLYGKPMKIGKTDFAGVRLNILEFRARSIGEHVCRPFTLPDLPVVAALRAAPEAARHPCAVLDAEVESRRVATSSASPRGSALKPPPTPATISPPEAPEPPPSSAGPLDPRLHARRGAAGRGRYSGTIPSKEARRSPTPGGTPHPRR